MDISSIRPDIDHDDELLLGMIVDRSSFDDEDGGSTTDELTIGSSQIQSTSPFRSSSIASSLSPPSLVGGRVRRRLRWKPAAFRSCRLRSTRSDLSSVASVRSKASIHSFTSTETPVKSNQSNQIKLPISRPNYCDTFSNTHSRNQQNQNGTATRGMSTINNNHNSAVSGGVHNSQQRMLMMVRAHTSRNPYDHDNNDEGEDDDEVIAVSVGFPSPGEDPVQMETLEEHTRHNNRSFESPGGGPITPPLSLTTTAMTSSMEDLPAVTEEEGEEVVGMEPGTSPSVLKTKSPTRRRIAPGIVRKNNSHVHSNPTTPKQQRRPQKPPSKRRLGGGGRGGGKPPLLPKVTPDPKPHKAYNRPIDATTSSSSQSTGKTENTVAGSPKRTTRGVRLSLGSKGKHQTSITETEDSQLSVDLSQLFDHSDHSNADAVAGNVVHHGSRIVPIDSSEPATTAAPSKRIKSASPVDVDDGAFVEAERNLRAIHEMAAEHLAHGEYDEALEVFQEILRGQKERHGENHYRIGTALHNIGIVHLKSGDHARAIEVCQEAVRVRKESLVPNHPDVAVSLAQLGVAYLENRQFRNALVAFREALGIRQEFLGAKHPRVGKLLNNIGVTLYELEELDGAKMAFEEALEIQRETLRSVPASTSDMEESKANSHQVLLSVASTLSNLGSIYLRRKDYEGSIIALEEALLIQQSVLGDNHATVITTMQSIDHVERTMQNAMVASSPSSPTNFFPSWSGTKDSSSRKKFRMTMGIGRDGAKAESLEKMMVLMKSLRWQGGQVLNKMGDYIPNTTPVCGGDSTLDGDVHNGSSNNNNNNPGPLAVTQTQSMSESDDGTTLSFHMARAHGYEV